MGHSFRLGPGSPKSSIHPADRSATFTGGRSAVVPSPPICSSLAARRRAGVGPGRAPSTGPDRVPRRRHGRPPPGACAPWRRRGPGLSPGRRRTHAKVRKRPLTHRLDCGLGRQVRTVLMLDDMRREPVPGRQVPAAVFGRSMHRILRQGAARADGLEPRCPRIDAPPAHLVDDLVEQGFELSRGECMLDTSLRHQLAVVPHQGSEPDRAGVLHVGCRPHDVPLIRRRPANVECPEALARPGRLCASRPVLRPEPAKPALDHVAIDRAVAAPGAGEPPEPRPALHMPTLGHLSKPRLEDEQRFGVEARLEDRADSSPGHL